MSTKGKSTADIVINLDAPCAECGKGGAAPSGICLACTARALKGGRMKSEAARNLQYRHAEDVLRARHAIGGAKEDRMVEHGSNHADAELKRRAHGLMSVLNQIADLQEEAKQLKAEAKADGYNLKALMQCVKELRRGPDYQAAQLELELELDTYRRAVALPVTLEAAQEAAREAAAVVPSVDEGEPDDERRPVRNDLN